MIDVSLANMNENEGKNEDGDADAGENAHVDDKNPFGARSITCKVFASLALLYLLFNEIKLFAKQGLEYLSDPWNYTDLLLMILYFAFVGVDFY